MIQATTAPQLEIVGVVSDVKQFGPDAPATADLYVPIDQMPAFQAPLIAARMNWVVRGHADVATWTPAIRSAVVEVDPGVAASSARTLRTLWEAALASRRTNVRLLEIFGNVAAVLCAIGVYGVAAFATRARRRELAIRAALGAGRRDLMFTLFSAEWRAVMVGLGLGFVLAFLAAPALFGGAFDVNPRAAATLSGVAAVLAVVAGAAISFPVRAGGNVNPADILRG
jgi:hypothetical protein